MDFTYGMKLERVYLPLEVFKTKEECKKYLKSYKYEYKYLVNYTKDFWMAHIDYVDNNNVRVNNEEHDDELLPYVKRLRNGVLLQYGNVVEDNSYICPSDYYKNRNK